MNIKKIKELKKVIKNAKPEAVSMATFFESQDGNLRAEKVQESSSFGSNRQCGSAGCIAGWTCLAFASPEKKKLKWDEFFNVIDAEGGFDHGNFVSGFFVKGKELLGLTDNQARRLFLGEGKGWSTVKRGDWVGVKNGNGYYYETKEEFIMSLGGEEGKKAILKQLTYMIKTGKV